MAAAAVGHPHPHHHHRGAPPIGPFDPNKSHDDPERWICIYPAYLNSKKSLKEGRRIPQDKAVENPTYQEIKLILEDAKLEHYLERKFYPRERRKEPDFIGRFRVHLKKPQGEALREEFPTRESVMLYVAEKIPQLKSRTNPKGAASAGEAGPGQGQGQGQGGGAGGGSGGARKKSKKK